MRLTGMAGGLVVVGAAAASLFTTTACGCLSAAEDIVGHVDENPARQKRLDKNFPRGQSVEQTRDRLRAHDKYCVEDKPESKITCVLPRDRNFWRETAAVVTFAYDSNALQSIKVAAKVRYVWE